MYLFQATTLTSLLLALSSRVFAAAIEPGTSPALSPRDLGINCRGSFFCSGGFMDTLIQIAVQNSGGCSAGPGQLLYCAGNICVFNQGTNEILTVEAAQILLTSLKAHGCDGCGSVPLTFPINNDPSDGIMTVNYVSDNQGCSGVCIPSC